MIDFLFLFPPAALTVDLQHVRSKQQLGFGLAKMLLCASVRQRKKPHITIVEWLQSNLHPTAFCKNGNLTFVLFPAVAVERRAESRATEAAQFFSLMHVCFCPG